MTDLPARTRVELRQKHLQVRNTLACLEKAMPVTCRALKVRETFFGNDYWFSDRTHALDFVQFIEGAVPVKKQSDDDGVSATFFSLQILPICQDDLIRGSAVGLGGDSFVICTGVAADGISLMGTFTLRRAFLTAEAYWRAPCFVMKLDVKLMTEFRVLDITPSGPPVADDDRYGLADCHIVRVLDPDDHNKLLVRTHLGRLLKPGDHVLGLDVAGAGVLVKKKSFTKPSSQERRDVNMDYDGFYKMLKRDLDWPWLASTNRYEGLKRQRMMGCIPGSSNHGIPGSSNHGIPGRKMQRMMGCIPGSSNHGIPGSSNHGIPGSSKRQRMMGCIPGSSNHGIPASADSTSQTGREKLMGGKDQM